MKQIGFAHGALADSYEQQANEQGYTLGNDVELFDKIRFSYNMLRIHGLVTDSEADKITHRIHKKLAKTVKPIGK